MGAAMDFGGRLPIHVRFMLDEFANMGVIPDADKKLSVMRSRKFSLEGHPRYKELK